MVAQSVAEILSDMEGQDISEEQLNLIICSGFDNVVKNFYSTVLVLM